MIAVLFARSDSVYHTIGQCDVWDQDRDARLHLSNAPVIAHPPCRGWGRLRMQSKPRPDEKSLAQFAVWEIRRNGGVLEHPEASDLWRAMDLPRPGAGYDEFGGWSISVDQFWWGHRARKRTWLYICGIKKGDVPAIPLVLGDAPAVVTTSRRKIPDHRPELSKSNRERTPPLFASWLVELAKLTATKKELTNEKLNQRPNHQSNAKAC